MSRASGARALVHGLSLLASLAVGASGCGGGNPQPYGFLADLEVSWSIAGNTSPAQCDQFGIDVWSVTASGPEIRQVNVDCRTQAWDTLSDFSAISEGNYQIIVDALRGGAILTSQSVAYLLIDTGAVQPIHLQFLPSDFPP